MYLSKCVPKEYVKEESQLWQPSEFSGVPDVRSSYLFIFPFFPLYFEGEF